MTYYIHSPVTWVSKLPHCVVFGLFFCPKVMNFAFPLHHGIIFSLTNLVKKYASHEWGLGPKCLMNLVCMPSYPSAFPYFTSHMVVLTSVSVNRSCASWLVWSWLSCHQLLWTLQSDACFSCVCISWLPVAFALSGEWVAWCVHVAAPGLWIKVQPF